MKGEVLLTDIKSDKPINIDQIDSPYAGNEALKKVILERGLDPKAEPGKDFNHGDQAVANIATLKTTSVN